jgi:hypothetical protein
MKKQLITLLIALIPLSSYCQINERFEIKTSKRKYPKALYGHIKFIEARMESNDIGFLLIGRNNLGRSVVIEDDLNQKFPDLLKALIDSTAKKDTLLFLLDAMRFSESTKYDKDSANFKLQATIFCKKGLKSYPIHKIDTTVIANFEGDMSYMIMVKASNLINTEIAKSLYKPIVEKDYIETYLITQKDSVNKSKLPLYTTVALKNGLYKSYAAFKMQQPDSICEVLEFGDTIFSIKVNGRVLNSEDYVYAIVHKNKAYIRINNYFAKIYKRQFDFYYSFNENLLFQNTSTNGVPLFMPLGGSGMNSVGNAAAGLIGGLIINAVVNSQREKERQMIKMVTYKISYKNGEPIFVKNGIHMN